MKYFLFTILTIFINQYLYCQTELSKKNKKNLDKIETAIDAIKFINDNPKLNYVYDFFSSKKDTSEIAKICFTKNVGEIISFENNYYKLIRIDHNFNFRASYIYIDGTKFNKLEIDSIRNIILTEYSKGITFVNLVKRFNMDENPNNGDLGWFPNGRMHIDFENEIKKHKKDEVFTLDINQNNWFYVVKKTFDHEEEIVISYIMVNQK